MAVLTVVAPRVLLFVFKQKAAYAQLLRETRLWPFRGNGREDQSA